MRVLFVDDEARLFVGMRSELRRERREWQLTFTNSGEQALAELRRAAFDALVTVMRTGTIDGPELLAMVRELYPTVVRLCLAENMEDETFLRAMPVTHQFVSGRRSADSILEVIERACCVRSILHKSNHAVLELIGKLKALPAAPQTFQALSAAMAKPDAHTDGHYRHRQQGQRARNQDAANRQLRILPPQCSDHVDPGRGYLRRAGDAQSAGTVGERVRCARARVAAPPADLPANMLADLRIAAAIPTSRTRTPCSRASSRFAEEAFTVSVDARHRAQAVLACLGDPGHSSRAWWRPLSRSVSHCI